MNRAKTSTSTTAAAVNIMLFMSLPLFAYLFPVIDCTLSEWGAWSECDTKCGTGMMSRTRSILRAPENGGKHCASLTQKRGCQGYKCKSVHDRKALKGKYRKN